MLEIRKVLSMVRRTIRGIFTRILIRVVRRFIASRTCLFQITFASDSVHDGLGAQIQRQLSIEALSQYLGIDFIPRPLKQIAIHPLDNFQTVTEMKLFLDKVNKVFGFESQLSDVSGINFEIPKLTIWRLFFLSISLRRYSRGIRISTCEVYDIVDFLPNFYSENLATRELRIDSDFPISDLGHEFICIHFRQGVGGKVVYPGQKLSRELDLEYFVDALTDLDSSGKKIVVLTDAPDSAITYKPVDEQAFLWDGSPKYADGEMSISGLNLKYYFHSKGFNVDVISGGDPLVA
jgi:hypothetical protein